MGTVVQFPKIKANSPPQSIEEMQTNIELSRREYIDNFLEVYMPMLFQRAYDEGFDLTLDKCDSVNSLFVEAFRAALLKSVDINHELQEFAEESMKLYKEETQENEKDN